MHNICISDMTIYIVFYKLYLKFSAKQAFFLAIVVAINSVSFL